VIERRTGEVQLFTKTARAGAQKAELERLRFDDPALVDRLGEARVAKARDDLELLQVAGNEFTGEAFLAGEVTPTFFGSALTNFGVEPFFDAFVELAPPPGARAVDVDGGGERLLDPVESPFSAYVFKIQANMDRRHRDCLAFVRVCSGKFERDLVVHHHRLDRDLRLSRPHSLVAQERSTVDVAYPGDIVGLINRDTFRIGDTLSLTGGFEHKALPAFQPEVFARVTPKELTKRKSFDKGMEQLVNEGTVQILWPESGVKDPIVAAVGKLQFEVLQYRLRDEYGCETTLTPLAFECSAWLEGERASFSPPTTALVARDRRDRTVVLFTSEWDKRNAAKKHPQHRLLDLA
jgi:peptide chain release factor 3